MSNLGTENNNTKYETEISKIIQQELIGLHGTKGYRSIIQTMIKISGRTEKEIITNYKLFAELTDGIFGRLGNSKILDPIKLEIQKIGIGNIQQVKKSETKKSIRVLIADDDSHTLELYKEWLKFEKKQVVTVENGQKCVEVYVQEHDHHPSENYFDVVILDQKMPKMTGLQAATEILKINPHQRIIFASGHLEKTLLESLTKLNKAIEVIEKPFTIDALDTMINQIGVFEKLEKININQEEKDISKKLEEVLLVLKNQN